MCESRVICEMTHFHVRHDSFIRVSRHIHVCAVTHTWWRGIPTSRNLQILCYVTRFFLGSSLTYVRCVGWHVWVKCDLWNDTFSCATWLIHKCDMTDSRVDQRGTLTSRNLQILCYLARYFREFSPVWVRYVTCVSRVWFVTWHICMCDMTCSCVCHDSFIRDEEASRLAAISRSSAISSIISSNSTEYE